MGLSLVGVAIQSLFPSYLRYSFVVFLVSSVLWMVDGLTHRNRPLVCLQLVLLLLNLISIYRYLIAPTGL